MRMKKALSLILMLCMLLSMAPFTMLTSAAPAVYVTVEKDVYASGESIPFTVHGMDDAALKSAGAWAAIYPASTSTYKSGGYADWLYPTDEKNYHSFPSWDESRHFKWPLSEGYWKVVLFGDGGYSNVAGEAYFYVGEAVPEVETTFSASKEEYLVGEDVVINYANSTSAKDWIAVFADQVIGGKHIDWAYTPDGTGAVTFTSENDPWVSTPGDYVVAYYANDSGNFLVYDTISFSIVEEGSAEPELLTEVYVSASGDDTAAGTAEAPVATMAQAMTMLDTAEDCTIYVSGSVAFADVAHTGTFTYVPADDTALFNSDVSLNGPSEIEISVDTKMVIYTNGNDTVMNNPVNTGKFNYFVAGNNDGTDETITFKGGYTYQNVYTKAAGDNAGDVNYVVDGAVVRMIAPGSRVNDNVAAWKQNVLVTVNSGELHYFNSGESPAGAHADGAFMAVFNNNTYTTFKKDYLKQGSDKVIFDKGYWIIRSTDTESNTLAPTSTPGKFAVSGEKTAWIQSADKKSVYYSNDGYITIPAWTKVMNVEINWAEEFTTTLFADAPDCTTPFIGWEDDGNGTITAKYLDKYYVASTGSDDNVGSADAPLATIAKAIEKMGADKDQTIVIMDTMAFADAAHTGKVTYEAYDENAAFNSTINLNGPTVLKVPVSGKCDLNTNGHYIEIDAAMDKSANFVNTMVMNGTSGTQEFVFKNGYVHALRSNTADDVTITVDGGIIRLLSSYASTKNININVLDGEFWIYNHIDNGPVTSEGAYQIVFNDDTFNLGYNNGFGTSYIDWSSSKISFNGGKYVIKNADGENSLLATSTAGKFQVAGEKDAYFVSADGKTVYYTYDGYITLPAGTNTILWADEFTTETVALPAGATAWVDNGKGTLTASFVLEDYYVSTTGDDTAAGTAEAPLATIAKAIELKGADEDFTIYVMGEKFQFSDVPHTGTVTIKPYDSAATLAGGTIKLQGPTKIHVNIAAAASIYPDGYDFELDGDNNASIRHDVFVGNAEGRPNRVALNGQYIRYLACFSDADDGTSDTFISIDGSDMYMLCPTPVTKGSTAIMGDLRVVVNSGNIQFFNVYENPADNSTDSGLVMVFNNNSYYHNFTWNSKNFTNVQDWGTTKIWFKGGEMLWRSADKDGNYLIPESVTEFTVVGDKTAYYQSADKSTVYYSVDGKITLPVLSAHTSASTAITGANILWTEEFSADMFELPEGALAWSDNGEGVLTASYALDTYYVSASGSDTAAGTEDAPLATIAEAIERRGADADFTIYVMGNYTFADAAHTGKITYQPYDENAKLAGGTIKIQGPSVINVDPAAAVNYYSDGYYLEIGGTVNKSIANVLHVGNLRGVNEHVVLKGQYFANVFSAIGGQENVADTLIVFDGAVSYNLRPDSNNSGGTNPIKSLGNLRVVLYSGELLFSNSWGTAGTDYPASTDAFVSFTFNNNTYHGITPHVFANVERKNFLDYFSSKFKYTQGESIWINKDTNGNTITPTATAGLYDVEGTKVAYYQSSDKKTVYYTYNGQIQLPAVNTGTISWSDDFSLDLVTTPGQQDGVDFVEWIDDGKGVITASYKKTPTNFTYYLKAAGTGDGRTADTPAQNVATVVASINADGHDATSEVTVYLIDSGEKRAIGDVVTPAELENYIYYAQGAEHKAHITFKPYGDATSAVMYMYNAFVPKSNTNTTFIGRGPATYENITIVDCRTDFPTDVYAQGYDIEFKNVASVRLKTSDTTSANIVDKKMPIFVMKNRNGTGTAAEGGRVVINGSTSLDGLYFGSYSDAEKWDNIHDNSNTIEVVNRTSTPKIYLAYTGNSIVQTYKGDINLVLNNTTAGEFGSHTNAIVNGAIQVVLNNNSSLSAFTANQYAKASADADLGTAKWMILDSKNHAGALDVTDKTGEFKVISDKKYAYAYSDDSDTAYYGEDILKVVNTGRYIVNYADSVAEIMATIPARGDNAETGELFTGWTDNGDGTISASFTAKIPETKNYYVVNGGTGDGRTESTPAGSVNDVIASVNADKLITGDTAVIYIMEHPDFIDETTGKFGDDGKLSTRTELVNSLFTYWKAGGGAIPAHSATLKITSYDYEAGNPDKPMKHLAYSEKIGANHCMTLSGPVIFEDVAIVRPRNVDREIKTNGYDTSFINCRIYQTNADFYSSIPFTGLVEDHANILVGGDNALNEGGTVIIKSPIIASMKNSHGIGIRAYGKATTFAGPVAVYLDHEGINSQFVWGNTDVSQTTTFNSGLSIVSNAYKNIFYTTKSSYIPTAPVTITGGLQFVNNNGKVFPEVPAHVKADATWIVNSAENAGGTLDITDVAGTFKVLGGKYAWAQSFDKKTVWFGNETITLPAGTYTINYADSLEAVKAAVSAPADIDEYNLFDGWDESVAGTLTAKYAYVIPTYYVAATGGSDDNNGLTAETAFATTTKAIAVIEANGKNGVINVIGAVTLNLSAHTQKIYVESYNGGTVAGPSNKISLCGPIVINADFAAAQAITTNGYYLELGGKVNTAQNNTITAGNLNNGTGTDEKIVLNGKFIHKLTTTLSNQKTGGLDIFIDGGILRQMSTGSGVEADGSYIVGDITVTVKSGEFWCFNHTDAGPHKTPAVFNYIANGNNYYFPDGRQLLSSINIKSWADYTPSGSDGFVKILFEGGKYVIRNADKENFIYMSDTTGTYKYEGAKTPYYVTTNGLNVYYGANGEIDLPAGEIDVLWAAEFNTDDLPVPALPAGYEFGGWSDNGEGLLTAIVINPNFFYVDSENGDDNNNGTVSDPFKTISKAVAALNGKNGTIYIVGSVNYDLSTANAFEGYVIIEGVDENAVLTIDVEADIVGNTTFKNITINSTRSNGYYAFGICGEYRLEFAADVNHTYSEYIPVATDGSCAKVVVNGGSYKFQNHSFDIVATNAKISLWYAFKNVNINAVNSEIYAEDTAEFLESSYIVANNSYVDPSLTEANHENLTIVMSESENGEHIAFTETDGMFNVKAEYGKTAIATAADGTIYVADEFAGNDLVLDTWYDSNKYSQYINYRRPLVNTYKKLTEDKNLKVAYFGGSVTNGSGNSWRKLISQWFVDQFPEATVTNINRACGESGTYLGTYRLQTDVISIKPDLVFLEYAINDKYYGSYYDNAASQCETIIREIKQALPETDIVVIIVSDTGTLAANKNGELHTQGKAHEEVATKYNVPSLHVGRRLAEVCNYDANIFKGTYATDIVHLTDAGNYVYYQVIEEFFHNSLFCTDFSGTFERNDELIDSLRVLFDGNRTCYWPTAELLARSEQLGGSGVVRVDTPSYGGTFAQLEAGQLVTEAVGQFKFDSTSDVFYFEFNGTDVALWSDYYDDNNFLISIDGGDFVKKAGSSHAPARIVEGLTPGNHTVGIKIADASSSLVIRSIYTRDTSKATPAGTAHVYTDYVNKTFNLPAGVYTIGYVEAETVADLQGATDDSAIFLGWSDGKGNEVAADTAIEEGMILVPAAYDIDDFISFQGVQIRLNEPMGLRFICELLDAASEIDGITVNSYGMVVLPSKVLGDERTFVDYDASICNSTTNVVGADKLTIGSVVEYNGKNYTAGTVQANVIFDDLGDSVLYTTCIIGMDANARAYGTYYTLRPYIVVEVNGESYTLYGDAFRSSIYEVAKKATEDENVAGYETLLEFVMSVER